MRLFFKRYAALGLLVSTLLLTGFGCKGAVSPSQVAATKPVTLTFWTVTDDVDQLRSLIAAYTANRPYLTINVTQLRADEIYSRLVEALAEDHGPDIISVNNRSLGQYLKFLSPLPPTVHDTLVSVVHGQLGDTTTITPQTRSTLTINQLDDSYVQAVQTDAVRGGKIYGLPMSFDTIALYYNKDLLDGAGIAEPPKTWDDFSADVKQLTKFDKATGKILQAGAALGTGSNVPYDDDLLYILYKQSQLSFVSQSGQAVFNGNGHGSDESPQMSVLDFYTDFANPARDTYTWNESLPNALDSFVNGTTAFFFGYSSDYATIKARAPQLNFVVLPMLQLNPDAPVNVANYALETVPIKSPHQDEAWGLITYLTNSAATKTYLDATHRPTALRQYVAGQQQDLLLAPFIGQALTANNWYHGSNYDAATQAISTMLHNWLLPPPQNTQPLDWKQQVLDRGAEQVNQTL